MNNREATDDKIVPNYYIKRNQSALTGEQAESRLEQDQPAPAFY